MYTKQYNKDSLSSFICPTCKSNRFRYGQNKLECTNCGYIEKIKSNNKYGAKKTIVNNIKYDSKFEASVAETLELRKRCKDILDFDAHYKVEMWIYREDGVKAFKVNHKVDFRIHHQDGSFELVEAKGMELPDWKWRRRLLEELWLPLHPDYTYKVVKQGR